MEVTSRSELDTAMLDAGYRAMAADVEREKEAMAWIKGLVPPWSSAGAGHEVIEIADSRHCREGRDEKKM